jgi:hypothetical protein
MNKSFVFLISFLMICFSSLIPISYIVGSGASFFSLITIVAALVGKYSSLWSFILFFVTCKKISFCNFFYFAINRTPLFFVGWSYKASNIINSVTIPLVCIILFIVHPIGSLAWSYSMYWLIPIVIFFSKSKNIFMKALGAVFTAHAVGSVIWIYTHEMDASIWISLIPIVALERIMMAVFITSAEFCISKIQNVFMKRSLQYCKEFA